MTHHLCNAFERIGLRTVFLGPRGTCVPREFVREYRLLEDRASKAKVRSGVQAKQEDSRIRRLIDRTVHLNSVERILLLHPFYYGIGALEVGRRRALPCSVYFHGFELRSQLEGPPVVPTKFKKKPASHSLRDRVLHVAQSADEVLTNSRYTASLMNEVPGEHTVRETGCGLPAETVERELHLTPTYDRAQRSARKAELGLDGRALLAYVGRLVPTKGVDDVIRLCAAHQGLQAAILGDGPDRERLEALSDALGVRGRVRFLGSAQETVKWRLLRAADYLCLLSRPNDQGGQVEGFGIALLEGAACGAVPVSSGTGGMRDVVQDGQTGLILNQTSEAAAERLATLHAVPLEMAELAAAARLQLTERYTWTRVASRIVAGW